MKIVNSVMYKETLINIAVKQIEDDIKNSDYTALYDLLNLTDTSLLENFIDEDELISLKNKFVA